MPYYHAFGIDFEYDETREGLVAAGRWTSGGNSPLARRLRVKLQRRDRYGRWAEMGGGISFPGRRADGGIEDLIGRYVGPAEREDYMRVYVTEGRRPGIYEVPCKVATVARAILSEEALKEAGVKLDINGNKIGDVLDRDIEFIDQMWKGNKPSDFELSMARGQLSKPEKKVIEKARLRAPKHKSYNIVDDAGKRIDKDEVPAQPKAKLKAKVQPPQKFPVPDMSGMDEKEKKKNYAVWYVGKDGKAIPDHLLKETDKTPENQRIHDRPNQRIIDGNGNLIEFKASFSPDASPIPAKLPKHDPEEGFWNVNAVDPREVRRDLTDPKEIFNHLWNGGFVEADLETVIAVMDYGFTQRQYVGFDKDALPPNHPKLRAIADIFESLPPGQEARIKRAINLGFMNEQRADELKAWLDERVEEGVPLSDEDMVELHRKFRNLAVDFTNIKVRGENAFTNDNMGAERINMPQLDEKDIPTFLKDIAKYGVGYRYTRMMPDELHPIQAEMDLMDIANIAESWRDDKAFERFRPDEQPIVISRDGYVLDGHHRWAAAWLAYKRGDKYAFKGLKVVQLDVDHEDALRIANEWNDHAGIRKLTVGGKNERTPRPESENPVKPAKATGPFITAPRQMVPGMNYAPTSPPGRNDNVTAPGGENFDDWLARNLANNGDKIIPEFGNLLTNDTPNPEDSSSPFPGSKTVVKNLLKYRDQLIVALKEAALDDDIEAFKFKYEVAKRVTSLINKIYENFSQGKKYGSGTELEISTRDIDAKMATLRILPNSIKTEVDANGVEKVLSLKALVIGKDGAPYLIDWKPGISTAQEIKPNGELGDPRRGGGTSFNSVQQYEFDEMGQIVRKISTVGSASTAGDKKGLGFGGAHILLTRWVQTKFGSKLQHSSNLSSRGNPYSKLVSRDMRGNNREQADKAVHMSAPNADIFKILKTMGLIDGEFIPGDPNLPQNDNSPQGYGSRSGGRGWLKRLTFTNNGGYSDNRSVLSNYSINSAVRQYDARFRRASQDEKQRILDAMPPIFRDYFAGDINREPSDRFADFDVQYQLLGTAYSDGMKKDDAVNFLNTLIDGLPRLAAAFNENNTYRDEIRSLTAIRDAISAHQWNQENNNYVRPLPFTVNSIRAVQSPFAGHFKFTDWVLPRDITRIMNEFPFNPRPRTNQPDGWTEDPQKLQEKYGPEILLASLRNAILSRKGKDASLPKLGENADQENIVNPNAIYKALENHGYDTEKILAEIYDELNGNTANKDALMAKRAELGNLRDIITMVTKEVGNLDEPVEFGQIGGQYDPETKLLQSDLVKRGHNADPNPVLDLRDLPPSNETFDYIDADGNRTTDILSSSPYTPEIKASKFYIQGITDSPKLIARNFSTQGLKNALIDAISNRRHHVKLRFSNGEELAVPNNAIRDALQHQGVDTDRFLLDQPNIRVGIKSIQQFTDETDGNIRTTRFSIGNRSGSGHGFEQKRNDTDNEYEWSIIDFNNGNQVVRKLASVRKNQDGNFEVRLGDNTEPDGLYPNKEFAFFDIKKLISNTENINASTNLLGNAIEFRVEDNNIFNRVEANTDSSVNIEALDINIPKPAEAQTMEVFGSGLQQRWKRVGNNGVPASTSKIFQKLGYEPSAENDNKTEELYQIFTTPEGELVRKLVYSIRENAGRYELSSYKYTADLEGGAQNDGVLVFDNLDDAKDFALRRFVKYGIGPAARIRERAKQIEGQTIRPADAIPKASAEIDARTIVQDNQSIWVETPVRLKGGIAGVLVLKVQKGKHPVWNDGAGNNYVFAEFEVRKPDAQPGEEPYFKGQIIRNGVRNWKFVTKGVHAAFDLRGGDRDSELIDYRSFTNSDWYTGKQDAFDALTRNLNILFEVPPGSSVVPRIRLVNTAAKLEPEPPAVRAVDGTGVDFDAIVQERSQPIDLVALGATDTERITGGASGARVYTAPDGRRFKVKLESERKGRSEALNHGVFVAAGLQVTEGRVGIVRTSTGAVKVGLVDPFVTDIVPGSTNGNLSAHSLFEGNNYLAAENQQVITDIREGLILDAFIGNWDLLGNKGNALVVIKDGVRRGVRCDNGAGMFVAIRPDRNMTWMQAGDALRAMHALYGDFMRSGRVEDSTASRGVRRGLTPDMMKDIARRTLLPFTDEKIDRLVDAHLTDARDNADAKLGLKQRRLEILNYLGIDPNEAPPTGTAARAPIAEAPTLDRDGYEILSTDAQGKMKVRLRGQRSPDGTWIVGVDQIPDDVKARLIKGEFIPENLPFYAVDSDNNDEKSIIINASGQIIPSAAGYTSVIVRRRKQDGTYEYLSLTVKPDGTAFKEANKSKYTRAVVTPNRRFNEHASAREALNNVFSTGVDGMGNHIISEKELDLDIPGFTAKHKVRIVDLAPDYNTANDVAEARRTNKISDVNWIALARYGANDQTPASNIFASPNDLQRVVQKLRELEQNWTSSPSNEPSDGGGGGGGSGNNGGNGPINPDGSSPSGGDSPSNANNRRLAMINVNINARVYVNDDDGSIEVIDNTLSETPLGTIKPLLHGQWVATFMPEDIGRTNANNGRAQKAFFSNKLDAQNWLAQRLAEERNQPRDFVPPIGENTNENAQDVTPKFVVDRGYLNPSSQAQTRLAKRLIKNRQATSEERAFYKGILSQENPTSGEVGWIIGQLNPRPDRDIAEIEASNQAADEANAAGNPVQQSSLDGNGNGADRPRAVKARDLVVGHRILGNINGDVVFAVPSENDTINVGVVGDDGKLKIYKVNKDRALDCIFGRNIAPANAPQQPAHPGLIARQNRSRLIQNEIKQAYPNHHELPNGDLVIGQRDHRMADGRVFRYEAVVHKLKSDEFVGYVRRQELDANGNPFGPGEAAYLTKPAHSAKALKNRLGKRVMPALNAANPANGFNQVGDYQPEVIDPATGLLLPERFVSQARFIGNTGIEATGHPAKDALIEYVQTLVTRGVSTPDIIGQVVGPNQRLFSENQMRDIIERLEANRLYPGVNAIPYVSKDNRTIVRVGDRVIHYDAQGRPILMANGQPRTGTVTERRPYTLNMKPNGAYEYTDQVYVQWDDTSRPHQAAPRRLEVTRRADGTAPVPAVQGEDQNAPSPSIDTLPIQPKRVVPKPVAVAPGEANRENIGAVTHIRGADGKRYRVERLDTGTQFQDVNEGGYSDIYVSQQINGKWSVKKGDGVNWDVLNEFDNREDAEFDAVNIIQGVVRDLQNQNQDPIANIFRNPGDFTINEIQEINNLGILPEGYEAVWNTNDPNLGIRIASKKDGHGIAAVRMTFAGGYQSVVLGQGNGVVRTTDHNTKLEAFNEMLRGLGGPRNAQNPPANQNLVDEANQLQGISALLRDNGRGEVVVFPGGKVVRYLHDQDEFAEIQDLEDGRFRVTDFVRGIQEDFNDKQSALRKLDDIATRFMLVRPDLGGDQNQPEAQEGSENPFAIQNAIDMFQSTKDFARIGGSFVRFPGGQEIRFAHRDGDSQGLVATIKALPDGRYRVTDHLSGRQNDFNSVGDAALQVNDIVKGFNSRFRTEDTTSEPSPSPSIPSPSNPSPPSPSTPPNGGDGGQIPPNNPPAGAPSGDAGNEIINLPRGARNNGPGGVRNLDEAPFVQTFWDDDFPPTHYEVVRTPGGTTFVGIGRENEGAVAFVRVEATQNGFRVVDPRERGAAQIIYDGDDRRVAEAIAINRMTNNENLNANIFDQKRAEAAGIAPNQAALDIPWSDKRVDISPEEISNVRSFEIPYPPRDSNNGLERINIERDFDNTTFFGEIAGQLDISVDKFTAGWGVSGITSDPDEIKMFRTRAEAEAAAVNSIRQFERDRQQGNSPETSRTVPGTDGLPPIPGRPYQPAPSPAPLSPGNGGNPPTNPPGGNPPTTPPAGPVSPVPAQPVQPTPAPQGRTRVNKVQPGDRYIKQNNRLTPNKDGEYTHFDVYDARTKKLIASTTTRELAEDIAAGRRDRNGKLIDYTTPIGGEQPSNRAPQAGQQQVTTGTRTNLGDGIFSVHNENQEYGIAVRGADGRWAARVHENAVDAINNANPISTGTYDSPEEAEAAIRRAIAERQAQRNAANILQWQSASDGKAYLGLDGVAGVDAQNAPIYGISPSPFGGGWMSAGWRNRAERDAGNPPSIVAQHQDEQSAKDHVQRQLEDIARLLGIQMPPLINDENPNAGREQLPPGTTLQDQVDAGVTTPFNPNAPLPNTPSQ